VRTWDWRGAYIVRGMWPTFLWRARDYQTEFLKRGGVRAIRWSIRRNASTASELPSSGNVSLSFFFGICGTPPCAKSEAKLSAIHIRSPVRKNTTSSVSSSLPFFAPCLCNSATISVARDGTLPPQPCPTSFPSSVPRARALWPLMSSTPTTRSRTLLFLSYRDSRASTSTSHNRYVPDTDADENERLIDPAKDHIAIDVGLPPKWSAAREDNHLFNPSLTFEPPGWIFRTE